MATPEIYAPDEDDEICGSATFKWKPNDVNVSDYKLLVGKMVADGSYCQENFPGSITEHECTGIPKDGNPVFATLQWLGDGTDGEDVKVYKKNCRE